MRRRTPSTRLDVERMAVFRPSTRRVPPCVPCDVVLVDYVHFDRNGHILT